LIPELFPFILKSTIDLVEEIRSHNGEPIDMDERFVTLTANIICEYIFGGVPDDGHLVFDNFSRPAAAIATIKLKHVLKLFGIKGKSLLEIERNSNIIRNVIRGVKRGDRKRSNGSPTLVEEMLQLEEFQGPAGEERLVHELLIMIMAGHDTTAHSLTMLVYVLALHPECQQKIGEEVDAIIFDHGSITAGDMGKLKYTSAAIRESMRLHPVLPSLLLHAYEDTSLGNIQIPKGSTM
jgi:cytochrome P450